jgi:outer membrane protein assembly factor BamB
VGKPIIKQVKLGFVLLLAMQSLNLQALPGQTYWQEFIGANIGSSVTVGYRDLANYVGAADGYVYAYDHQGKFMWRNDMASAISTNAVLAANEQSLFVVSQGGRLSAINTADGQTLWGIELGQDVYVTPSLVNQVAVTNGPTGTLYVATKQGRVLGINAVNGAQVSLYETGSNIGATPAVAQDGNVYVGTETGDLFALNSSLQLLWQHNIGSAISSAAIGINDRLYVGAFNHYLYSIDVSDAASSRELWSTLLGGRVASNPVIDNAGFVYAGSLDDGKLNAINTSTGVLAWSFETGDDVYGSAALTQLGDVIVASTDGIVYSLAPSLYDAANPAAMVNWTQSLGSAIYASPTIASDGTILIASKQSLLTAIEGASTGLANSPWPMQGRGTRHSNLNDDTDGDGVSDAIEASSGLDNSNPLDGFVDGDGDGLMNYAEARLGTDIQNPDTDGDQLKDGWEYTYKFDASATRQFDPFVANDASLDLDGDTLTSLQEANLGSSPYSTDTDDDGLPDKWEAEQGTKINVHDASSDKDSDGLSNLSEYQLGTLVNNPDTDGDGMSDGFEVRYGFSPTSSNNDANKDSDLDGLTNLEEYSYRTNPLKADTDGDGVSDGAEVTAGTDPNLNIPVLIVIVTGLILN